MPKRREMLADRRIELERLARENRERKLLPTAYGKFVAELAAWDWFMNPISLRDRVPGFGPPVPGIALSKLNEFLTRLQHDAGRLIGWVIAEEFGLLGGRLHYHALITGVRDLPRGYWERQAYRCLGRTRIRIFDPKRGAAYYLAKFAGKPSGKVNIGLGGINLGGFLKERDLSKCEQSHSPGGGRDVVVSAPLPRNCFHRCLPRWHR